MSFDNIKIFAVLAFMWAVIALVLVVLGHGLEAVPVALVALVFSQLEQGSS